MKILINQHDVTIWPNSINHCYDLIAYCNLILLQDCPSSPPPPRGVTSSKTLVVLWQHALRLLRVRCAAVPSLWCVFLFRNVPCRPKGPLRVQDRERYWKGAKDKGARVSDCVHACSTLPGFKQQHLVVLMAQCYYLGFGRYRDSANVRKSTLPFNVFLWFQSQLTHVAL